jgi:hypothetical protein
MSEHDEEMIKGRYRRVAGILDERGWRAVAASEAMAIGRGGIAAVARATGLARVVIEDGIKEVSGTITVAARGRVRRPGGGRKKTADTDPGARIDLERLVEPTTRGDPESALRWTCKGVRRRAAELQALGHRVSHPWVAAARRDLDYSVQGNRKTREGRDHPDRDAPFAPINQAAEGYLAAGNPVISVDAKKKELGGDCKNGGRVAPQRGTGGGADARFCHPGTGAGDALRSVRRGRQRRLGQRGPRP